MLIQCDAKQLEWRTAVELSQDPVGLTEILDDQDTHSLNEQAFHLPSRLIAKRYLFRTIFRGTGYSFSIDPDFLHVSSDPAFWDDINVKFYSKYDGLNQKHFAWKDELANTGRIVGPFGRFWVLPLINQYGKLNWTQLTNYPVQGTGADIMSLARVSFFTRLNKLKLSHLIFLVSSVHDSIVVDAPSEYLSLIANLFHEVFRDLQANIQRVFGYKWIVPLECEVKFGPNLKDMKEYV